MVTVWLQVALLVQQSVACHVRVMVVWHASPLVTVLRTLSVRLVPQQTSKAIGSSKLHAAPHSTVLLVAQVNTGGVVSVIATVWLQVVLLVQQSVACHVRVMIVWQESPFVTVFRTVSVRLVPQQTSEADGSSKFHAAPHSTVLLVAQVRTGGVVSVIVTVWLHVALLVQQSVACHVRVMVVWHASPLVTVLSTVSVRLVPQQTSAADGSSKLHAAPHSTVLLVAQVNIGGVVSLMVTVWLQVALLVQQSVARQVRVMAVRQKSSLATVLTTVRARFVPQQASKATGSSKLHATPHSTVLLVAQVNTGGVVSVMVTV